MYTASWNWRNCKPCLRFGTFDPGTKKSRHAATRIKAREMSYKFVWVRNGRIFVRKTVEDQAIVIKNLDSLNLLI